MSSIKLLDCTLRDGGYINDWQFGYHTIRSIIKKLTDSQSDYVEVGFLRDCEYDREKTLYNNCEQIAPILPEKRGNTVFTAMALHNKYSVEKLEPYDGKTIDIVRVTFHDYDIDEGLAFIKKVMDKGYKVACNPINIMGYPDEALLQLLKKVNEIHPFAFSIVDTFGSMMRSDLVRIYSLVEHNLDGEITIGLHLHENLALSYSLAQEFIAMKASGRKSIIDASMLGMGRTPGNLCMELIMDYMNRTQGGGYDINPILDGIDDHIAALKRIEPWGYSMPYAISAKYNLHRNYAEFLIGKGRLRAKQINQILAGITEDKKTAYDEAYIEKLYREYQDHEVDDSALRDMLRSAMQGRKVLVLAPGASLKRQQEEIDHFVEQEQPFIFSANFVSQRYETDYIFCSNAMRYDDMGVERRDKKILVTSNLLDVCEEEHVLNYAELNFDEKGNCDNCVIMLLKLLYQLGVSQVYVAGFDGYQEKEDNYISSYMVNQHTKGMEENVKIRKYMEDVGRQIEVVFLTDSLYNE